MHKRSAALALLVFQGCSGGSGSEATSGDSVGSGASASAESSSGTTSTGAASGSSGASADSGSSTGGANAGVVNSTGGAAGGQTTSTATSGATVGGSSADKPSTDTTWDEGLTSGPNGPIPIIVVDQFGYRPTSAKVAVIRDPQTGYDADVDFAPGSQYAVVDQASGDIVMEGAPIEWNGGATDDTSGDRAWWFDFSDVTSPGTYTVVDVDNDVRSVQFDIRDDVYKSPLKHAVRTFYYQRAGFPKSAETAGSDWADDASHLGPGQDSEAHAWTAMNDEGLVRDLHGGWYDAGDYNKYTAWAAATVIVLLRAYEENPTAFDDDYGIAESGNGVSDLLDEVKWALEWLERMQNTDGSLLCILGVAGASPPSAATDPSYYGPATTNASLMGAAAFAYASKIYGAESDSGLNDYAETLADRAIQAWTWADANPNALFYNNDESLEPGSSGLGAGQQETDESGRLFSKFQAATYLYEMTGDATYRDFADANYEAIVPSWGPSQWDMEKQDAVLYYAGLDGVSESVRSAIVTQFVNNVSENADQLPMVTTGQDPYRAPMVDYTWGSNQIKMAQARLYRLLAEHGSAGLGSTASAAAEDYLHYIHGVNPFGLVYLTNMQRAGAEHSAKTAYHSWFADGSRWDEVSDTTPGPAPGFLVGGPNPSFSLDSCCTAASGDAYQCYGAAEFALCSEDYVPPLEQPSQKAYLEFNSGWPAGSWAITEPSTGYQAKYILVLSAYAR